jgi:hypothetical protein
MIVIDVQARLDKVAGPAAKAEAAVRRLEKTLERVADAWERVAAASQKVQAPALAGGGGGRRTGGGPGLRPPSPADVFRYVDAQNRASGGRFQPQRDAALMSAWRFYQARAQAGDPGAVGRLSGLAGHVNRLQNRRSPLAQAGMNLLYSTRFGVGAGGLQVAPLVGRTVAALGKVGPVDGVAGAAVGGLAMAVVGFVRSVIGAAGAIKSASFGADRAGTSMATSGVLSRFDGFFGQSTAGMAEAFGERIRGGGVAAAYASRAGINPVGGVFGDLDYGKKFEKYLRFVAASKDRQEALRRAHAVGAPEIAGVFDLTKDQQKRAFGRAGGYTESERREGVRASFEASMLADSAERLMNKLLISFGPGLRSGMKGMEAAVDLTAKFADTLARSVSPLITIVELIERIIKRGSDDDSKSPVERNTRAVEENTRAMREFRETIGGGARAQGALPRGIGGQRMSDQAYREALAGGLL